MHKRWSGGPPVLAGLDLEVHPGEVVGLVGDNGAGKSTALGIAAGLVRADAGEVRLFDRPADDPEGRRTLGVVPEGTHLPRAATVDRYLSRLAALSGGGDVDAVLALTGLQARRSDALSTLSRGMRRKVLWAQALVHSPRLLLLDEPFTALDATSREAMLAAVRSRVADGVAVLVTSHRGEDLDALDARRVTLVDGRAT